MKELDKCKLNLQERVLLSIITPKTTRGITKELPECQYDSIIKTIQEIKKKGWIEEIGKAKRRGYNRPVPIWLGKLNVYIDYLNKKYYKKRSKRLKTEKLERHYDMRRKVIKEYIIKKLKEVEGDTDE